MVCLKRYNTPEILICLYSTEEKIYMLAPDQHLRHILVLFPDFSVSGNGSRAGKFEKGTLFGALRAINQSRLAIFVLLLAKTISFAESLNLPPSEKFLEELGCFSCHKSGSDIKKSTYKTWNVDYLKIKNNPAYLFAYLKNPKKIRKDIGASRMPNFFLSDKESLALAFFLVRQANIEWKDLDALTEKETDPLETFYLKTKTVNPGITADTGEKIFNALNCPACHNIPGMSRSGRKKNAPSLNMELFRVKKAWLRDYLKKPVPIRLYGFPPGTGGRMPDFGFSDTEVEKVVDFFVRQNKTPKLSFKYKTLSPFSMNKGRTLLSKKLPCLGCHRLGKEGGVIGPDLSNIVNRLNETYIYSIIKNPKDYFTETIMPKIKMPENDLELIVNYLIHAKIPSEQTIQGGYPSFTEFSLYFPDKERSGKNIYLNHCSSCHGLKGDGKGFNAPFLPVKPTDHTDGQYMSQKTDDTLFDAIYGGGYILNKSNRMPSWGNGLSLGEIFQLVEYLRELCHCEQPGYGQVQY